MIRPLVSIIVPVYNSKKWLKSCLDSILNQSYQNIEVLLIDDGSKDESVHICDEYGEKDFRVRVIHKKNEGVSIARNYGINASKGEFLQFVDSDDIIHPKMTEQLVKIINEKKADVAMCDVVNIKEKEMLGYNFQDLEKIYVGEMTKQEVLKNIIRDDGFSGFVFNKLFRKDIIKMNENVRFDSAITICEDLLFCCEYLSNVKKVVYTNEKLYGYVEHMGSAITTVNEKFLTSIDAKIKIAKIYDRYCLLEGRSYYIYSIAHLFTFINTNIIKKVKKELKRELREKKGWFKPEVHTKKEVILFFLIYISPYFFGDILALMRKMKKK